MCGMYGHGFYWKTNEDEYAVVFDFEINSHSRIKQYRSISETAIRIGFDPVDGTAVSNSATPMPLQVQEKIEMLFSAYFPNPETISEWLRNNYGKNIDREEWEDRILSMLSDDGVDFFSRKYYEQKIENYEQSINFWGLRILYESSYSRTYYEHRIKVYEQWITDYKQKIKNYEQNINYCTGTLDNMDIDKFIPYFLSHPNKYWVQRCEKRKIEYKSFVNV